MIRPATENDFSKITLIEKDYNVLDFNQILNGLKLITDYLDKSILRPNNISHPKSRIDFLNLIKE